MGPTEKGCSRTVVTTQEYIVGSMSLRSSSLLELRWVSLSRGNFIKATMKKMAPINLDNVCAHEQIATSNEICHGRWYLDIA